MLFAHTFWAQTRPSSHHAVREAAIRADGFAAGVAGDEVFLRCAHDSRDDSGRWAQLRTNVFATKRILARVDELAALLEEAQQRNYQKWPILGRPINPNYFVGSSYEEEVAWMKKFIEARLGWMERQFPPVPRLAVKGDGAGQSAELSAPAGAIYVTLDGNDPRASGGEVSKSAQAFKSPLPLHPGAKLFARVRQENRWSGPVVWSK